MRAAKYRYTKVAYCGLGRVVQLDGNLDGQAIDLSAAKSLRGG